MFTAMELNIYGLGVNILGLKDFHQENLKKDFSYFINSQQSDVKKKLSISVHYSLLANIPNNLIAKKQSQNSITYQIGSKRYNDYYGKAVSVIDYKNESVEIYSEDDGLLYEILYLVVLSRSTKFMDLMGLHKLHAAAFHIKEKNIVVMMPSKGGKTSLFMEFIKDSKVGIISDDTPVVDKHGHILPFPLRLGHERGDVLMSSFPYLKQEDIYTFKRQYYCDKKLVSIKKLKNKVITSNKTILIVGIRTTFNEPKLKKINGIKMLKHLCEHMIIGVGLPMVIEYFIQNSLSDHISNIKNFCSRLRNAIALACRSECYVFYSSSNISKNADLIRKTFDAR